MFGILSQMRSKAKKLLITTQRHEIFVIDLGAAALVVGYCETCGAEAEMLTLDSAVKVSGISARLIIERIGKAQIHSIEIANGHLLICRNSLSESRTREA